MTHAPFLGSQAIDAGNPAQRGTADTTCEATDQRGVTRPQDGHGDGLARCDIGAFELESMVPPSSAQQIRAITSDVQNLVASGDLNHSQGNALTATLDAALRSLDRHKTNTVANQLGASANQVAAFQCSGVLSAAHAHPLVDKARALRAQCV